MPLEISASIFWIIARLFRIIHARVSTSEPDGAEGVHDSIDSYLMAMTDGGGWERGNTDPDDGIQFSI